MPFVPYGMKRVFLAFPLDISTKQQIAELIKQLQPHFEHARWVWWENFHITVHFIGEIPANTVDGLIDSVKPVVEHYHRQSILVNKIDYFGSPCKPRVLLLTASPKSAVPPELGMLANDLHELFEHQIEVSTFMIHITLARFRKQQFNSIIPISRLNEDSLEAIKGRELAWGGQSKSDSQTHSTPLRKKRMFFDFEPMKVEIDRVVLYESIPSAHGVIYEELHSFNLLGE